MCTFGQIFTLRMDSKLENPYINIIKLFDDIRDDLPILVIGYDNAKKYADLKGYRFNILDKKFSDNEFWTFSKTERRNDYENDIRLFNEFIIKRILKRLKYYYVNVFKLRYGKIKNLYSIIFSESKKYLYIGNEMLYCLYKDNNILGISLKILKYCGINVEKALHKLYLNKNSIILTDKSPIGKDLADEEKFSVPYLAYLEDLEKEKIRE
jgi:hypothetical protein